MTLWTQRVEVLWRSELGFFEKRTELLRELEDAGLLAQFRWTVDDVTVRIGQFEGITIGLAGATCFVTSPKVTSDRVRAALRMVLNSLQPRDVLLHNVHVRRFAEIDDVPKQAQLVSAAQLVTGWMPSATPTDWALLMDGQSRSAPGQFQVEFGVVSREEANIRLSRQIGRVGPHEVPFGPDLAGLLDSAFFFDWNWTTAATAEAEPFTEIVNMWDAIIEETAKLSEEVRNGYANPEKEKEAHG